MDAQERAKKVLGDGYFRAWPLERAFAEQVRQAEQAAREKALEEALRALGQQSPALNRDGALRIVRTLKDK